MGCIAKTACGVSATVGVILIAVGVGLSFYFQSVVRRKVNSEVVIRNGSATFTDWVSPPAPVYLQFYIFDVKNAYEIVHSGDKPIVIQKGPYTYKETRNKEDVMFSDNGTVSYVMPKFYTFIRNMSAGSEGDTVTTPNVIMMFIAAEVHKILNSLPADVKKIVEPFAEELLDFLSESGIESFFKNMTVHDLLWGYRDPLLAAYNEFRKKTYWLLHLPQIDEVFGLFHKPGNGSYDGNYTVYTGETSPKLVNSIYRWKGLTHVDYWNTTFCNMINGTDGSGFHPFLQKDDVLRLFSTDICRSLYTLYERKTVVENIELYRFVAPKELFEDHVNNPDNLGFCVPSCLGSGVLHLSSCKQGAPIVASQPHFYEADDKYINAIIGMHPNKEDHETFLDVEPITGVGMHLSKKLQINVLINSVEELNLTRNFHDLIFPILWVNESALIDKESAHRFKHEVYGPIQLTLIVQYGMMGFGAFICFCVLVAVIVSCTKSKQVKLSVQDPGTSEDHRGLLNAAET